MRVILAFFLIPGILILGCFIPLNADPQDSPVILILGDSLSAGYGMDSTDSWVNLLKQRLEKQQFNYRILNSSISGDTTQGGLARLPRLLKKYQPEIVLLELGANDGLRGVKPAVMRQNMATMIRLSQQAGAEVILAGIKLPPNYGQIFTQEFESIYTSLAKEMDTFLIPFFMRDTALNPKLLQADGIHPNESGQPILLDNVWPVLEPVLKKSD